MEESFTIKLNNFIYLDDREKIIKDINIIKNIPPEIAQTLKENENNFNNLNFTFESDIWSLGCITYELITGVSAFNGNIIEEIIDKIIIGKYKFSYEYYQYIDILNFINEFLQYFPKKRFNFDKIKGHDFLTKKPEDFYKMNNFDIKITPFIEINSKDCENVLWGILSLKKSNNDLIDSNPIQKKEENNILNDNQQIKNFIKDEIIEDIENLNNKERDKKIIKENEDIKEKEITKRKKFDDGDKKNHKINFEHKNLNAEKGNSFEGFEIIEKYESKNNNNNKKDNLGQSSFIEI